LTSLNLEYNKIGGSVQPIRADTSRMSTLRESAKGVVTFDDQMRIRIDGRVATARQIAELDTQTGTPTVLATTSNAPVPLPVRFAEDDSWGAHRRVLPPHARLGFQLLMWFSAIEVGLRTVMGIIYAVLLRSISESFRSLGSSFGGPRSTGPGMGRYLLIVALSAVVPVVLLVVPTISLRGWFGARRSLLSLWVATIFAGLATAVEAYWAVSAVRRARSLEETYSLADWPPFSIVMVSASLVLVVVGAKATASLCRAALCKGGSTSDPLSQPLTEETA
jgi:hypothetical protein